MKTPTLSSLLLLSAVLFSGGVQAEKADRLQPMNIEADAMRYDDLKQANVFTGRVLMSKGSIIIRGARVDVHQDAEGNQFGVVTAAPGKLAYFKQKRDGLDEFMEGEAETIEYNSKLDNVRFSKRAVMRRLVGGKVNDEITGAVIVYDNTTDVFTVDGGPASGPNTRVRAMLTPKVTASAPLAPAVSGPALRPSSGLEGEKK